MTSLTNTAEIASCISKGLSSLAQAFVWHWPGEETNDSNESNIALHLGIAFSNAGYSVFTECTFPRTANSPAARLDLLAIHPAKKAVVAIECKKIFRTEHAQTILKDIDRISAFLLAFDKDYDEDWYDIESRWGAVVCTTKDDRFVDWWMQEYDGPPEGMKSEAPWVELHNAMDRPKVKGVDNMPLFRESDPKNSRRAFYQSLYWVYREGS